MFRALIFASVFFGTVCLIVTIVGSIAAHTGAVVVAEGIFAGGVDLAEVDFLEALVDISKVAVESVTSEAIVADAVVTTGKVGALGIDITYAVVSGVLISVGAVEPVALVAFISNESLHVRLLPGTKFVQNPSS